MKQLINLLVLLLAITALHAQSISVASFRALPTDMTARVTDPVKDRNGDKCALIKVVTTESGFGWEGGMLGIMKAEKKTGEYWVYVPYGAKKLTIKHDKLGVLRNYLYPEPIKIATVYEMVLTTGKVTLIVEDAEIPTQWLLIESEPDGADVSIDEVFAGTTPFQKELELGRHAYSINKPLYHPSAGVVELKKKDSVMKVSTTLKPNFGKLNITSLPEPGAEIILDDVPTAKITPFILDNVPSGKHIISLRKDWYAPIKQEVVVQDGQTANYIIRMIPAYSNISIKAEQNSQIYVNNEHKGTTNWTGRMMPGMYTFEARKDKHHNDSRKIEIFADDDQTIKLEPLPITGDLKIISTPFGAEVRLNGEKEGKTPLTLRGLLIGEYNIELHKDLFATYSGKVTVKEGETTEMNRKLDAGVDVRIVSKPSGAKINIDGKPQGYTPKTLNLTFGKKHLKLTKNEYTTLEQNIHIEENTPYFEFELISEKLVQAEKQYKKYRNTKYFWLGMTAISAGASAYFYMQVENDIKAYPDATHDATDIHNRIEQNDLYWQTAAGVAGFSLIVTCIKSIQQKKAKKRWKMAVVPAGDGAAFCLQIPISKH